MTFVLEPSGFVMVVSSARNSWPRSHAYAAAVNMMPAATAVNKSMTNVTIVTSTMTMASERLILRFTLRKQLCVRTRMGHSEAPTTGRELHSNVATHTMTITPTMEAVGMRDMSGVATRTIKNTETPATTPEMRYWPLARMLVLASRSLAHAP